MFEIFIIFLKFSICSKCFENFAIFQNMILVISVLTNRMRDTTRGIYNKVAITFCFVQYYFYCNIR